MTTLNNPITTQNIVDRFADYVRDTANAGISWGTNTYPFSEWTYGGEFGGDTNGKGIEITGGSIGTNSSGEMEAQKIYDTLITETYRYTKIRTIRAILNVEGGGGNTGSRPTPGVVYDQTAIAYLKDSYRQDVSAARDDVYAGNIVTAGGIEVMLSNMRNAYNDKRAVKAADWQTNVCHASCHSSCHGSRGRR